jgi:hypothetical protein
VFKHGHSNGRIAVDAPQGEWEWRERAEQLQRALDSRVVIEQAKGMLRERLGLPMDSAFELLRAAARRSQTKLQVLAGHVVGSFETPKPLAVVLGLRPNLFSGMSPSQRALQTEGFRREVNDAIATLNTEQASAFRCECADLECVETIEVSADDLLVLHSPPGYYAVLHGHEIPSVEDVIFVREPYLIVQKHATALTA